jgi:exopolysaccharide biosynthesis polyprenyl glycosylphosphotransferase
MNPSHPRGGAQRRPRLRAVDPAEGERRLREAAQAPQPTIATRYGRRDWLLRRALAGSDLLAIAVALGLALMIRPERAGFAVYWELLLPLPLWLVLFRAYGLYERDVKRINHQVLDDIPGLFHALLIGTLGLWTYSRLVADDQRLIFVELAAFAVFAVVFISLFRTLARRGVTRALGPERVVVLGQPEGLASLVRKIQLHPEYGIDLVGMVPPGAKERAGAPLPVLGTLEDLDMGALVAQHAVERAIVSHAEVDDAALLVLLQECGGHSVKVSVLPRYVDALGPSVEVDDIEGTTVLGLNPLVLPRSSRLFKRATDIVGSSIALVLLLPLMALIAFAIRLDSPGPILFRQERIGRRGRCFALLKFRTMVPDAEARVSELLSRSTDPHWLKLDHDPRITRVGRFLRLMSLDELPQFWNVLRGQMSLVGPRPLVADEDARVTGWARTRLDLAPGITGLWQVLGRTNIPFTEMVTLDTLYVTNWSLWLDIKLILRTFRIVVSRQGAN